VVSIVIPTHDRPQLLPRAVESAVRQEGLDFEVIVMDDGSNPVVDAASLPERVTLIRSPQALGAARARNLAAQHANGAWIAFLDDDDFWAPDHLRLLLAAATECGAQIAYSPTWVINRSRGKRSFHRAAPAPESLGETLLRSNSIGGPSCAMISAELFRSLGGFDTSFSRAEDWDLWLRACASGRAAATSKATACYVTHSGNKSSHTTETLAAIRSIAARYADRCEGYGLRFGEPHLPHWIARLYEAQGRRGHAAVWFVRSSRNRGYHTDWLRALKVLLVHTRMNVPSRIGSAPTSLAIPEWVSERLESTPLPAAASPVSTS
jgi:glycosyltransferase involved in cell wall biosynthesis